MDSGEPVVHSFVIKLWREEAAAGRRRARWRGYITHVPSGARRYLHAPDEIVDFIRPYLGTVTRTARLRAWLRRQWRRWRPA